MEAVNAFLERANPCPHYPLTCHYANTAVWWLGIALTFNILFYLLPHIWVSWFRGSQNLKKRYDAEWALVTGGSSGIGLSLTNRLAQQGLNVVVAAFPDKLMEEAQKTLPKKYPSVKFVFVPVNLAEVDKIAPAFDDHLWEIVPQVAFRSPSRLYF